MKRSAVHSLILAGMVAGLAGCQSGPRWTWWKPWEQSSTETALADNSEAPKLPSASATPQAVAALQPAASPSSTNLASTGSTLATPALGVQPASPATLANAPLATYPNTGAPPIGDIPSVNIASTRTTTTESTLGTTTKTPALAAMSPTAPLANVPASGPYDPNGYNPGASLASLQPSAASGAGSVDRYGSYTAAAAPAYAPPPSVPPVSTATTAATSTTASDDRYAMPAASAASVPSATTPIDPYASPVPASHAAAATSVAPAPTDPYGPLPTSAAAGPPASGFASQPANAAATPSAAPIPAASTPVASVTQPSAAPTAMASTPAPQIKLPAGQYRPGGTSSYAGGNNENRVDVASRPGAPATVPSSVPQSAAPPSDPWAPQPAATTTPPATRHGGSVSVGGSSVY